jgi:two-component system response regulator CpxR
VQSTGNDDTELCESLARLMAMEQNEVSSTYNVATGSAARSSRRYDLVVLGVMPRTDRGHRLPRPLRSGNLVTMVHVYACKSLI